MSIYLGVCTYDVSVRMSRSSAMNIQTSEHLKNSWHLDRLNRHLKEPTKSPRPHRCALLHTGHLAKTLVCAACCRSRRAQTKQMTWPQVEVRMSSGSPWGGWMAAEVDGAAGGLVWWCWLDNLLVELSELFFRIFACFLVVFQFLDSHATHQTTNGPQSYASKSAGSPSWLVRRLGVLHTHNSSLALWKGIVARAETSIFRGTHVHFCRRLFKLFLPSSHSRPFELYHPLPFGTVLLWGCSSFSTKAFKNKMFEERSCRILLVHLDDNRHWW